MEGAASGGRAAPARMTTMSRHYLGGSASERHHDLRVDIIENIEEDYGMFVWPCSVILAECRPGKAVVTSDLPMGAGLGSSTAFCVSMSGVLLTAAGAVSVGARRGAEGWEELEKGDLELVNQWAFQGEKIIHGKPSGIDNSVSTFGAELLDENISSESEDLDDGTEENMEILSDANKHDANEDVKEEDEASDEDGTGQDVCKDFYFSRMI
ncbi:unnamed protein product [Miscanthus lutarioriparius]|uniref:GHMP kinase N-terminal domain-containing protein n=1 Tax=Miscanthus lutarioriparius TaxID=422564 RepID=A0A811PWI7_9POAL|nr:unnamed protein product [Miscanthus lutarioriparius]